MNGHILKDVKNYQRSRFNKKFRELAAFVKKHKRFPGRFDHPGLYAWVNKLRNRYKKNELSVEQVVSLNEIDFIWELRTENWFGRAEEVKLLLSNKIIPSSVHHALLYQWLRIGLSKLLDQSLTGKKRVVMKEINTIISEIKSIALQNKQVKRITTWAEIREDRWDKRFSALVEFRKTNPTRWPMAYCANKEERQLATWCYQLRRQFSKQRLSEAWITKLEAIGFVFQKDNLKGWKQKLEKLNLYLKQYGQIPGPEEPIHTWARMQYVQYHYLQQEKQELLNGIGFLQYFESKDNQ